MKLTKSDFQIASLEDELRVDGLCRELLMNFYLQSIESGMSEHEATLLANSADYFLRDYLIGSRQMNLLEPEDGVVRKFAGNWYIVNTLEPVIEEIETHLKGTRALYGFLRDHDVIDADRYADIEKECADIDYYRSRIDAFWDIKGDGYLEWERACSLK